MTYAVSSVQSVLNRLQSTCWQYPQAIVRDTFRNWGKDNVPRLAAALSCYAILSVAPLGILSVALAGAVFGQAAARGQIAAQIGSMVGPEAARSIESLILNAHTPGSGLWGTAFGIAVLLFGASGVFVELKSAMNKIWKVEHGSGRLVKTFVRKRIFSFAMVLGVAILLLLSLLLSATLSVLGRFLGGSLPGGEWVWRIVNVVGSLAVTTSLFTVVFKFVPDIVVPWKDLLPGAFVTASLFTLGKLLLSLYIEHSWVTSSIGAVGSLVALLVWVYVSSQVFFFGVELTAVWVNRNEPNA